MYAFEGLDTGHVSLHELLLRALHSFSRSIDLWAGTRICLGCVAEGPCRVYEAGQAQQLPAKAALAGYRGSTAMHRPAILSAHHRSCCRAPPGRRSPLLCRHCLQILLSRLRHPCCCLVLAITMSMLQVVARVVEPRISDITIERIDDSDQPVTSGVYPDSVYTREISSYFKVRLSELHLQLKEVDTAAYRHYLECCLCNLTVLIAIEIGMPDLKAGNISLQAAVALRLTLAVA